ncbi:MAG: MFS transporter [Candidatus Cloacimonadaceae bacterium]|nr:MFS transporter [Candidatus Cloacimonadaceae bacterium]
MRFKNLNVIEHRTAILLLVAALFNGVVQSLNQTQDIIARKALLAQDWQLMLMTMIWPISNFFSIWWGRVFEKSCHKSRYFLIAGIIGRLTLVYAIWLSTMNEYLVLLGLVFSANSLLIPAQNSIYQKNIDVSRRAKVYGYTISLGMLVSVVVTFFGGRLLDIHEQSFRWILLGTGLCGFASCAVLSLIRIQEHEDFVRCEKVEWRKTLFDPIQRTLTLLKVNKPFAAFERSYSIYGMGFIMMQPIIPIYLVDKLQLSYTANFMAKGVLSQMGLLLLSPMIGRIHDRMHPFKFISRSFALLMVVPLHFVLSSLWQGSSLIPVIIVFVAYLIFGIAMAAVNISWNMSSIFFAGKEDASMYQSVHVTMTGIRGLIAPVLGFTLLKVFNLTTVFVVAAGFLAWASLISYHDYKKLGKDAAATLIKDSRNL